MNTKTLLFALFALAAGAAQAAGDYALAYHGKLAAYNGATLSTKIPMEMEFRLYDSPSATNALWGRLVSVRIQSGGVFYTELRDSSGTALDDATHKKLAAAIADRTIVRTLDYIDAPAGAYIDTDVKPNQDTRVVMDVTVKDSSKRDYWFGAWEHNGSYMHQLDAFAVGNDGTEVYSAYPDRGGGNGDPLANGRHTIDFYQGVLTVTTDGDTYVHTDWHDLQTDRDWDDTFELSYPIWLFVQNRAGEANPGKDQVSIRLHSCQIYDGDTLVRDYVPAEVDGETGLYDRQNATFYANAGSGTITGGPISEEITKKAVLCLGITPAGYGELSPRQPIGGVLRAERAAVALAADNVESASVQAEALIAGNLDVGGQLSVTNAVSYNGFAITNTIQAADRGTSTGPVISKSGTTGSLGASSGGVTFTDSFDTWYTTTTSIQQNYANAFLTFTNSGIGVYSLPVPVGWGTETTSIRNTYFIKW